MLIKPVYIMSSGQSDTYIRQETLIATTVPPTSTDTSVFIRNLRALYGYTDTTLYYTEDLQSARAPVHPRPRDERDYARPLPRGVSAAAAVYTFVGVSGDGMQEPPNESDASVSTLIIVFGSYALYSLSSTFTCTVYVWIRILGQNILINQSKSTEHKFGGLEALLLDQRWLAARASLPSTKFKMHQR